MHRRDFLAGGIIFPASSLLTQAAASTPSDLEGDDNATETLAAQQDAIERSAWYLECASEEISVHSKRRISEEGGLPAHADRTAMDTICDSLGSLTAVHGVANTPIAHQAHPAMQKVTKEAAIRIGRASFAARDIFRKAREHMDAGEIHRVLEFATASFATDIESPKAAIFPREMRDQIADSVKKLRDRIARDGGDSVLKSFERRLDKLHRRAEDVARRGHKTGMLSLSARAEREARMAAEHWRLVTKQNPIDAAHPLDVDFGPLIVGAFITGAGLVEGLMVVQIDRGGTDLLLCLTLLVAIIAIIMAIAASL
ncbi:hypothetical protein HZA87_01170 [Candidatus Uhrbacteria bacterium]|nr:hypothetical protein [Candidatus Uhrbacteria bacterium]